MKTGRGAPASIDEYIAGSSPEVQEILKKIRRTVREAAPEAEETIKYRMPTFTLDGNLVFFAAFKNHISFYPPVTGAVELRDELSPYEGPKGSLKFPLDQPIPYELIRRIVKYRAGENRKRAAAKRSKK